MAMLIDIKKDVMKEWICFKKVEYCCKKIRIMSEKANIT